MELNSILQGHAKNITRKSLSSFFVDFSLLTQVMKINIFSNKEIDYSLLK